MSFVSICATVAMQRCVWEWNTRFIMRYLALCLGLGVLATLNAGCCHYGGGSGICNPYSACVDCGPPGWYPGSRGGLFGRHGHHGRHRDRHGCGCGSCPPAGCFGDPCGFDPCGYPAGCCGDTFGGFDGYPMDGMVMDGQIVGDSMMGGQVYGDHFCPNCQQNSINSMNSAPMRAVPEPSTPEVPALEPTPPAQPSAYLAPPMGSNSHMNHLNQMGQTIPVHPHGMQPMTVQPAAIHQPAQATQQMLYAPQSFQGQSYQSQAF